MGKYEKGGVEKIFYFPFSPSLHLLTFSLIFLFLFLSVPQCLSGLIRFLFISIWFKLIFYHRFKKLNIFVLDKVINFDNITQSAVKSKIDLVNLYPFYLMR